MHVLRFAARYYEDCARLAKEHAEAVLRPRLMESEHDRASVRVAAGVERGGLTARQRGAKHDRVVAEAYADLRRAEGFRAAADLARRRADRDEARAAREVA